MNHTVMKKLLYGESIIVVILISLIYISLDSITPDIATSLLFAILFQTILLIHFIREDSNAVYSILMMIGVMLFLAITLFNLRF